MSDCRCPNCGWPIYANHTFTVKCGKCGTAVACSEGQLVKNNPPVVQPPNPEQTKREGILAWEKLHSMQNPTLAKIENWLNHDVPKYGCDCANFARGYIQQDPPPLDDRFFRWTYDFHCAVDAKIGDEPISWEDAKSRWTP